MPKKNTGFEEAGYPFPGQRLGETPKEQKISQKQVANALYMLYIYRGIATVGQEKMSILQLRKLFADHVLVSAKDVRDQGIPTKFLTTLLRSGEIQRVSRGLYSLANSSFSERTDYEIAATLIPHGVICLLSALRFHDLTDENPHEISMMIEQGVWHPVISYPPIRFFSASPNIFEFGIEEHSCDEKKIKVYSVARTIADCFKYRNRIGLDIAIAALRTASSRNSLDYNELWKAAKICRVANVMQPYMEAMQ